MRVLSEDVLGGSVRGEGVLCEALLCFIDVHVCETVAPSLRSAEPVLYRHRQREAVVADRRHGSVTPTGGGGAGGGACHVTHQRGRSETKCTNKKDTLNYGHLCNVDTVCSNHIRLCTNLPIRI